MHRHVFIFAGDEDWQKTVLNEILLTHENDTLWLGENAPETILSISLKKAQSWLGREKRIVVFDATEYFDPDSFAAISGIVVGGGLFILLMPPEEQWKTKYSSAFEQRLIRSIKSSVMFNIIKQADKKIPDIVCVENRVKKQDCEAPYLTFEQQHAVEHIEKEVHHPNKFPVVLISDRGRGKSAALGIVAARLMKTGIKKIAITAPRLRVTDVVFKHIEQLLPNAEIKRGQIILNDSVIQFYAPDLIQQDNVEADLLLVDEAAAIPVPLLTSFLNKFPQCVFSTTVHGYEGTGRGFSVRFTKILNEQKPGWKKIQMKTPIRWAEGDHLEKWIFSLLCLDAKIADKSEIGKIDISKLDINTVHKSQLIDDELLLNEIFSLLILAHYRTQPSDLQRLLDDKNISLFIVKYKQHIVAIALVNHEGEFSKELSTAVYRGERRPSGHLLAQALTYHCGVEHAATLQYARVMRIAVHPDFQGQGIGTKFLDYIQSEEVKLGFDAIGTSFGMTSQLLKFWGKADFNVIRIGFTREQSSGEHAAMMMKSLSKNGENVYLKAHERFNAQCPFWFEDSLKKLPNEIKQNFQTAFNENRLNDNRLTDEDKNDLNSFISFSRNYELCIAAINKLILSSGSEISGKEFPEIFRMLINNKIFNKRNWKQVSDEMGLNGKEEARRLFKEAVKQLMINIEE